MIRRTTSVATVDASFPCPQIRPAHPDTVSVVRLRRVVAALTAVVLAGPIGPAGPASAAPQVPRGGPVVVSQQPTLGRMAATVPCPKPKVAPPPNRPARPVPPPDDPVQRAVGGDALATSGLTIAPGAPAPPALTATSWLVADLDTGEVLGGCGPHVHGTPASVQKLLLAATALPGLDADRIVKVTDDDLAIEPGSSAVGLLTGGRYSVRTLWLGLLLNSGNDAANVLARVAGGEDGLPGTIAAMNAQAKRLGAYQTRAVTPSGLDAPGQFTSAYDLALIARACFEQPEFRRYAMTERTQIPAQPPRTKKGFEIQNENKLVFNYPGALGGKTGFTTLARHSYVGAAERNGRRLVATLLGAEARPLRGWQQGAALLDWGFSLPPDASVGKLVTPEDVAGDDPAAGQSSSDASAAPARPVPVSARASSVNGLPLSVVAIGLAVGLAVAPVLLLFTTRRRRVRRRVRRRA